MNKKSSKITYLIILASVMLTKVLGLVRNMMLSGYYGTSMEANSFLAVSKIPLTVFDITLGTAIAAAFIPVFNEKLANEGPQKANKFASNFTNLAIIFALFVAVVGFCFPSAVVKIFASGFEGEQLSLSCSLVKIIMPIILFATATFIFIAVLQSYNQFIAPALVSLFSNSAMILYFIFLNRFFGIKGLAVALTVGWSCQLLFLVPFLIKKGYKHTLVFSFSSDIKKVLILTLPLFISSLAQPINNIISTNISSSVSEKGVSVLSYAYDAYFIVANVFAYALTNMYFPEMSRRFAKKDNEGASEICSQMLKMISTIILPIMAFIVASAKIIIKVLYQRGQFTDNDTLMVASALMIYVVGMLSLSWQEILNKFFYSMQNSKIPMVAAILGIVSNLALSFALLKFMGIYGLALATVLSGMIMAAVLIIFCVKKQKGIFNLKLIFAILKNLVGALGVYLASSVVLFLFKNNYGLIMTVLSLILSLLAGAVVYFVVLFMLKSDEAKELIAILKSKRKGGKA